jgi:hypothetical protein
MCGMKKTTAAREQRALREANNIRHPEHLKSLLFHLSFKPYYYASFFTNLSSLSASDSEVSTISEER